MERAGPGLRRARATVTNFSLAGNTDAAGKANTYQPPTAATTTTEGQLPDRQWMRQSFTDQIRHGWL